MEDAVVGAVVGASIQVLLQNLLTISQEQINSFWYCKDDLETLKNSLSMVNEFLHDAEMRQVTNNAVKRWMRELEALAYDADNVYDDINYKLLSENVETTENKTVIENMPSFFSISNNPIVYGLTLVFRIKDILKRLKSINQRANEFGLAQALASGSNASGGIETDSFTVEPFFCGRKDDVERIVGMLISINPSPAEQVLSILPIVGMGGLGKTTLTREVFNDERITKHFKACGWVHVPRNFDVIVLLKKIFTSLMKKNAEHGDRQAILTELKKNLGAKKYLLVLDDVWNEDREKWNDFVKSFSGICSATGNCMIVTTRSQEVASNVKTLPVHNLRRLSDGECWSIIEAKAFRGGDSPSEFETIGINIAKKCQGLPLAAEVFGGLLFGKSKDEWLVIEKNPLSNFRGGDYVYKILKLSFDYLSSPSLKKCFAFCSMFPKGYNIKKEKLIELWMAEGFLQADRRDNINMETVGSNFLNILVQNSLLQVARRDDYDNVTHCNMHDLVHDLSYSILHENDKDTGGVRQSRYIGWKPSGDGLLSIPQGQEKYVRTLFFNGEISDINFSDFESLRSLTLVRDQQLHGLYYSGDGDTNNLPTSIGELKHLRYLDISELRIRYFPDSIGELYHMQTLRTNTSRMNGRAWGNNYLKKLPDSSSNLINLRHLHISEDTQLPPEIGKLTSLQTLPYFHVGSEKGHGISNLGNMTKLKGRLEIHNLEDVRDKKEAMSADLLGKAGIYELRVAWVPSWERKVDEANDDESVLEGLQPHPNLKSLTIFGFKGKILPQWTSKMAVQQLDVHGWEGLNNLMEILLNDCSEIEELPALGHLPHLKSLNLCSVKKVRSIGPSFYNIKDCSKSRTSSNGVCEIVVFPALESLELGIMPNLIEWAEVDLPSISEGDQNQLCEVTVFPRLENLRVDGCTQLTRAPSHFPRLKKLYFHDMDSGLALGNICGMKLNSLTSLTIRGIKGLECLPRGLFSYNHNLSSIHIQDCPSLGELPIEMVESCAPTLEFLILDGLSSITNLGMAIGCLHRMPNLRFLYIRNVPKFSIKVLDNTIGSLRTNNNNLQDLQMGPFPDSSWDNVCYNEAVDAILFPQFISLRRLTLFGKQHWECLPVQLQHLTSLQELSLCCLGIKALPEWVENLSSLERLELYSCEKLRHLPSKQAMLRLSKLTTLEIHNSPLLIKEKRRNYAPDEKYNIVDSERPKISHIPFVKVDFFVGVNFIYNTTTPLMGSRGMKRRVVSDGW